MSDNTERKITDKVVVDTTKIGRWEVSESALSAYWKHIEKRIYRLDQRDVAEKEYERKRLHDAITDSAHITDEDATEFLIALQNATDDHFEGCNAFASWS